MLGNSCFIPLMPKWMCQQVQLYVSFQHWSEQQVEQINNSCKFVNYIFVKLEYPSKLNLNVFPQKSMNQHLDVKGLLNPDIFTSPPKYATQKKFPLNFPSFYPNTTTVVSVSFFLPFVSVSFRKRHASDSTLRRKSRHKSSKRPERPIKAHESDACRGPIISKGRVKGETPIYGFYLGFLRDSLGIYGIPWGFLTDLLGIYGMKIGFHS